MSIELLIIALVVIAIVVGVAAVIHPAGVALLIVLITPFDPLMTNIFGLAGNYITILPVVLILIKNNPSTWGKVFLGTRVQRAFFIFLVVSLIAFAIGYSRVGLMAPVAYLQRLSGFAIVGILAVELRNEKYLDLCIKIVTVGMALFALVSMFEFYLGVQLVPTGGEQGLGGIVDAERVNSINSSRLPGAGRSVPINRLALQLMLPIGLAMGWLVSGMRRSGGIVQLACLVILLSALFGTMSRSGILGLAVGASVVAFSAYRLNPTMVFGTLILAIVLGFGSSTVLSYLDVDEVLMSRLTSQEFDTGASTRQSAWRHGYRLFADSPVWGVGYGVQSTDNVPWTVESRDPHNAYIRVFSYFGILGGAFFFYMVARIWLALLRSPVTVGERMEYWRPYFLAGFCSILAVNFFNSYFYDRYMFIIMGFAAAVEASRQAAWAEQRSGPAQEGASWEGTESTFGAPGGLPGGGLAGS